MERKNTVLVVDDSRMGLTHLAQILSGDYIVHTASSGIEALQLSQVLRPDIILLDIVMPLMDGYEALLALQNMEETKDTPVIFITGLNQDCDEEKGLRLGAVDYISKPYNPVIAKLRVATHLKIHSQMRTIVELSLTDVVSKLYNRRYFEERFPIEWDLARIEGRGLGILLVDIDKLRTYNMIYGYAQGDEAVIAVSNIIKANALPIPGSLVARWVYGGFVILLQNTESDKCYALGEEIRKSVENARIVASDGTETRLSVSVGVNAVFPKLEDCTNDQFLANADSALYLAKEMGRNLVVVHS